MSAACLGPPKGCRRRTGGSVCLSGLSGLACPENLSTVSREQANSATATAPKHQDNRERWAVESPNTPSWTRPFLLQRTLNRSAENPSPVNSHGTVRQSNGGGGCGRGREMLNSTITSVEEQELDVIITSLVQGLPPFFEPTVEDSIVQILHRCREEKDRLCLLHLYAYACKIGLEGHPSIGNGLVSALIEVDCMRDAKHVFDRLDSHNDSSWNSLITGYLHSGRKRQALIHYDKIMEDDSVHPSPYTFIALLKACIELKDMERGRRLHAHIQKRGLLEKYVSLSNTLITMYAKCGSLDDTQELFHKLRAKSVVAWNALIISYIQHGRGEEALNCLQWMQREGISPNPITYVRCLKACICTGALSKGREIHAEIARKGLLQRDVVVASAVIEMYSQFGLLAKAQEVFDQLQHRDVVLWTILIGGYAQHGLNKEALNCFELMQLEGISPDAHTCAVCLKACGSLKATEKGQEIHSYIAERGSLQSSLIVGTALVDMYAKCGLLRKAQQVFDNLSVKNVVSWTALIDGYVQHGCSEEALNCFEQMQLKGISPNAYTLACSLKACGNLGATDKGQELHAKVAESGSLEEDIDIGTALVDMYAKCGLLAKAAQVFEELPVRDKISWNALIAGYAQLGETENVFCFLDKMIGEGRNPDSATFMSVLTACSHSGRMCEGHMYFEAMSRDYALMPTLEHHSCMVDLFGRAGQVDKAIEMIKKMPFQENLVVWHTVLAACRKWGHQELGRHAFDHSVGLERKDTSAYISMYNIYSDVYTYEVANKVHVCNVQKVGAVL